MSRRLTVRIPDELFARLERLSAAKGASVTVTVKEILGHAAGAIDRRERLQRFATWTQDDVAEFEQALAAQRASKV